MPKGIRKEYSAEFKLAAVFLMKNKTMKPKEIYTMLNVDRQTIYRWVQEYDAYGEEHFRKAGVLPGPEVKRLQKEKANLEMENEILKKAIAYFAERNVKK